MKLSTRLLGILAIVCFCGADAAAQGITESVNAASVIDFPTALDQTETHVFHAAVAIVDLGEPDVRLQNLRYGLQVGNFQLLTDVHMQTEPSERLNFAEIRAKLRVLPLDEISTDIAVGVLGRIANSGEKNRIDDREASLFAIWTSQIAALDDAEPLLINFYLDNLFFSMGAEMGFYQFIKFVAEADFLHSQSDAPDRNFTKVGIEIEGEQNFYFQIYYSDRNDDVVVQIGTGF